MLKKLAWFFTSLSVRIQIRKICMRNRVKIGKSHSFRFFDDFELVFCNVLVCVSSDLVNVQLLVFQDNATTFAQTIRARVRFSLAFAFVTVVCSCSRRVREFSYDCLRFLPSRPSDRFVCRLASR